MASESGPAGGVSELSRLASNGDASDARSKGYLLALSKEFATRPARRRQRQPNWCVCAFLKCFNTFVGCHVSVHVPRAACVHHHPGRLELLSKDPGVAGFQQLGDAIHALWPT